jgi:hypothetical protein
MAWPEMQDADLETFKSLDKPTRTLVLRLLDSPTDKDHDALDRHPNGAMLASWLLTLPAYANSSYDDDED